MAKFVCFLSFLPFPCCFLFVLLGGGGGGAGRLGSIGLGFLASWFLARSEFWFSGGCVELRLEDCECSVAFASRPLGSTDGAIKL